MKLIDDPYGKPLFPPKLEWFDIFRGESPSGELLAAYEFFECPEDEEFECGIPPAPTEIDDEENGGDCVLYTFVFHKKPIGVLALKFLLILGTNVF